MFIVLVAKRVGLLSNGFGLYKSQVIIAMFVASHVYMIEGLKKKVEHGPLLVINGVMGPL